MWPDELEELVYVVVRIELVKRRRQRAAACLTRHVRARLTRRWFVMRARLWLWQGRALLWPHPVAMHVSWDVMRAAHPGSKIFGQSVRPRSPWQHMLVASVHRGEMFPGMTPPMGLPMCGIRVKGQVPPSAELLFADVHAQIDQSNTANVHGTAEGQRVRRKAFSLENLKLSLSPLVNT